MSSAATRGLGVDDTIWRHPEDPTMTATDTTETTSGGAYADVNGLHLY